MKTIERKFHEMCDEIDHWKAEAEYWRNEYDNILTENAKRTNEDLEDAKKGVANALMFALSVKDDENGNLVIDKKDRKKLADNLR